MPSEHQPDLDDRADAAPPLRQRCLDYLLGEMPLAEQVEFEQQLDRPEVAEALAEEARLLTSLACEPDGASPPCPAPPLSKVRPAPALAAETHSNPALLSRLISIVLAVAATITIAFFATHRFLPGPRQTRSDAFQLQLARALVEPGVDWEAESEAPDVSLAETALDSLAFDSSADNETWDWLIPAVRAQTLEGQHDDG